LPAQRVDLAGEQLAVLKEDCAATALGAGNRQRLVPLACQLDDATWPAFGVQRQIPLRVHRIHSRMILGRRVL